MGESKRRQDTLGEDYGKSEPILPGIPITKYQSEQFVKWSTRGAWGGIILLIIVWLTIRFIGPLFGWWQVN
jgi:Protein of unknown function (DUF2839)